MGTKKMVVSIVAAISVIFLLNVDVALAIFTDNGDGTVTDTATGLMWQKDTQGGQMDWDSAITYCENLSLAGHSDWYLPDLDELKSLIDTSIVFIKGSG